MISLAPLTASLTNKVEQAIREISSSVVYHLHTLMLFTYSDLKTTVGPMTIFGVFSVLSGPVLTTSHSPQVLAILFHVPQVAFWSWVHTLFINVGNQRQLGAAEEDGLNKPWRPLSSKRLTTAQAKYLMLTLYPTILSVGLFLGALPQSFCLMVLGYVYNDLGGADKSVLIRNALNAIALPCFGSGATMVALASSRFALNHTAHQWFFIIGLVYFTTVQIQDLEDQAGDSLRQRRTLPLVLGDGPARWTVAIPVSAWSFICPLFFGKDIVGLVMPVLVGALVASRIILVRTVEGDKQTFRYWNLWMIVLFTLPVVKHLNGN